MSGFRPLLPTSDESGTGFTPLRGGEQSKKGHGGEAGGSAGFRPLVPGRMGAEVAESSTPGEETEAEGAEMRPAPKPTEPLVQESDESGVEGELVSESTEEKLSREADLSRVREEAYELGRAEGLAAGSSEIAAQVARLDVVAVELERLRREMFERTVEDVAAAVHHIARAVVKRELMLDSTGVKALVLEVLEHIQTKDEVLIRVSPEDLLIVQEEAPNLLSHLGRDSHVRIQSDPELSAGGVRVETQLGAVDASVETRFSAFADAVAEWAGEEANVDDVSS